MPVALHTSLSNSNYDRLVWRPDAFGSICFLVSGAIAYRASARHGWLPARGHPGWWEPAINLLGCIFFGISAVAGYLVPSTGSLLNLAWANWNTALGAACFLTCALATLLTGRTLKSPRLRRLHQLEHDVESDVQRIVRHTDQRAHRSRHPRFGRSGHERSSEPALLPFVSAAAGASALAG
ncbi:MAG: hypothetical protein WBP81_30685 [Solirubrobacteraceae bacterium]